MARYWSDSRGPIDVESMHVIHIAHAINKKVREGYIATKQHREATLSLMDNPADEGAKHLASLVPSKQIDSLIAELDRRGVHYNLHVDSAVSLLSDTRERNAYEPEWHQI